MSKAPEHRIAWSGVEAVASRDREYLKNWEDGIWSTVYAADKVAKNNRLGKISSDDFVENAHWLGYWRGWERL